MPTAAVVGAAAAAGLAALTLTVLATGPLPGEAALSEAAHVRHGWPRAVGEALSTGTESEVVLVAAVAVAAAVLALRRPRSDLVLVAPVLVVVLLVPVLKDLVDRPRPGLEPLPGDVSTYAFPSGHAAATAALGIALVLLAPGSRRRTVAVVTVVGLVVAAAAQLVLARHHPSDLLAGWLLALACATAAVVVRRRLTA